MPWEYVAPIVSQNNPLKNLEDWVDPVHASYDISCHAYLEKQGASDRIIQLAIDTNCHYGTSAHDVSALMLLRNDLRGKFRQRGGRINFVGKGGNQRVPEGIANHLKRQVALRKIVSALRSEADGVDVYCSDGSQYRARFVICSVPVPVLQDLRIEPVLTGIQEQAVKTMDYALSTQVHITAKRPFWEDDGLPPSMWTDGPAGMVSPSRNEEGEIVSLAARASGFMARYLDRLGPEAAKAAVIQYLEEIRPAAKGQLTALHFHSQAVVITWSGALVKSPLFMESCGHDTGAFPFVGSTPPSSIQGRRKPWHPASVLPLTSWSGSNPERSTNSHPRPVSADPFGTLASLPSVINVFL